MGKKLSIKLDIAGKIYPMNITEDEEEIVRKAGKSVTKIAKDYKLAFSGSNFNDRDILAMVALQCCTNYLKVVKDNELLAMETELKQINTDLEIYLDLI